MSREHERGQVIDYLLSHLIKDPIDEVEKHTNHVIESLAQGIRQGEHTWEQK